MFEAYKIGVVIALRNAAGVGLRSISREMQQAHRDTLALQRDVKALERITGPDGIYARRAKQSLAVAAATQRQAAALDLAQRAKSEQQMRVQQQLERAEREYAARRTERVNRLSELAATRQLLLDRQAASEKEAFQRHATLRQKAEAIDNDARQRVENRQARMLQLQRRHAILEDGIAITREQNHERLSRLAQRRAFYEDRIAARQAKGRSSTYLEARLAELNRQTDLVERKAALAEKRYAKAREKNDRDMTVTSAEVADIPKKRAAELAKIEQQQRLAYDRYTLAHQAMSRRIARVDDESAKIKTRVQNAEAAHLERTTQLRERAARLAAEHAVLGERMAAAEEKRRIAAERAADYERRRAEAQERRAKREKELADKREKHERVRRHHALVGGLQTAGLAGLAVGGGIGWALSRAYDAAKELQRARSELQAAGIGPRWRERVEREAVRMGDRIPTSDTASSMRAFLDLRQVFGDERMALQALPNMLRASAILSVMGRRNVSAGQLAEEMAASMGRAIDMRGMALDPESFFKQANEMARVMIWSGGQITPTTFQQSFKYMRGARYTPTDEFMYRHFPSWIAATKSSGGGSGSHGGASVGFSTLTKAITMGYGLTKDQVALGVELGVIDPNNVNAKGRLKPNVGFKYAGLGDKEAFAFGNNPFLWIRDVLRPAIVKYLEKQGKEVNDNTIAAVGNMLIRTNAAQDVLGMALRNVEEIERDAKMIRRGGDISAYRMLLRNNPEMAGVALRSTWFSFKQEVGDALVPFVLEYLPKLTRGIRSLTRLMDDNPELTRSIVKWTAYTGGLAALGGAVSLATSGILGLFRPLRVLYGAMRRTGSGSLRAATRLTRLARVFSHAGWAALPGIASALGSIANILAMPVFAWWATRKTLDVADAAPPTEKSWIYSMLSAQSAMPGGGLAVPTNALSGFVPKPRANTLSPVEASGWHPPMLREESVSALDPIINIDLGGINLDGRRIGNYVWRDAMNRLDAQATSDTGFDRRQNRTVQGAAIRR